ncbi:MAG: hypothetical protein ACJA08_003607, partial [Cyclobacteriaceae bacterium]
NYSGDLSIFFVCFLWQDKPALKVPYRLQKLLSRYV